MKPGAVNALGKGAVDLAPWLLSSTSHEVASLIVTVLHVLTYVPLVLLPAMQDAHLKLVIVLNTSLCLCLMTGNVLFHTLGIVKVFPKMLDTFLLALYASMVPVVYLQYGWLSDWINVYHNGAVACFIWLTILLPCWDSFATEALRDRMPEEQRDSHSVRTAGLRISQTWGLVLTLCTTAALPPVLLTERHKSTVVHIICDYIIVLALLAAGGAMQWATTARLLAQHSASAPAAGDVEAADAEVGVLVRPRPAVDHGTQPRAASTAMPASSITGAAPAPAPALARAGERHQQQASFIAGAAVSTCAGRGLDTTAQASQPDQPSKRTGSAKPISRGPPA